MKKYTNASLSPFVMSKLNARSYSQTDGFIESGIEQMLTAMMASADHFNNRVPTIVPKLASLWQSVYTTTQASQHV